jgi:hypothetical protein
MGETHTNVLARIPSALQQQFSQKSVFFLGASPILCTNVLTSNGYVNLQAHYKLWIRSIVSVLRLETGVW